MFTKATRIYGRISSWDNIKWQVTKSVRYSGHEKKCFSTAYNIVPQPNKTASEDERREYNSLFPTIVKDLTEPYTELPEVTARYAKVLQHNIPNHKQASGLAVVGFYKMLEFPENLTPRNIRLANILGWCVDLILCSFKITDDIMDSSETRCGIPCWYRNEGVGSQAINDALLIENGPYVLLKKYFSEHHCYFPCVEWLHEATIKTGLGQSLDTMNRLNGKPNLEAFTITRHRSLAKYKGTIPEFLLPMKLTLYLAGRYDANSHETVENIVCKLGEYLTVQNDILDCYGDPSITGKVGSDIREGKATWLVVTALQRATRPQRKLLKEHYGRSEPESELKIRTLYEELGILDAFLKFEVDSYNALRTHILQMPKGLATEFFLKMTDTTFGRED